MLRGCAWSRVVTRGSRARKQHEGKFFEEKCFRLPDFFFQTSKICNCYHEKRKSHFLICTFWIYSGRSQEYFVGNIVHVRKQSFHVIVMSFWQPRLVLANLTIFNTWFLLKYVVSDLLYLLWILFDSQRTEVHLGICSSKHFFRFQYGYRLWKYSTGALNYLESL